MAAWGVAGGGKGNAFRITSWQVALATGVLIGIGAAGKWIYDKYCSKKK